MLHEYSDCGTECPRAKPDDVRYADRRHLAVISTLAMLDDIILKPASLPNQKNAGS